MFIQFAQDTIECFAGLLTHLCIGHFYAKVICVKRLPGTMAKCALNLRTRIASTRVICAA